MLCQVINSTLHNLQGKCWSLDKPVFLFDRCWLRLDVIRFDELKRRLPPDCSEEAPELIKYNHLLREGNDPLIATQQCWLEFGMDDFYRAIRSFWQWQDKGNNGWTFCRYIDTLNKYRSSFDNCSISIPLIILARQARIEHHSIEWIVNSDLKDLFQAPHKPT